VRRVVMRCRRVLFLIAPKHHTNTKQSHAVKRACRCLNKKRCETAGPRMGTCAHDKYSNPPVVVSPHARVDERTVMVNACTTPSAIVAMIRVRRSPHVAVTASELTPHRVQELIVGRCCSRMQSRFRLAMRSMLGRRSRYSGLSHILSTWLSVCNDGSRNARVTFRFRFVRVLCLDGVCARVKIDGWSDAGWNVGGCDVRDHGEQPEPRAEHEVCDTLGGRERGGVQPQRKGRRDPQPVPVAQKKREVVSVCCVARERAGSCGGMCWMGKW
jgi:hypothetical protein